MRIFIFVFASTLAINGFAQERPQKRNNAAMVFHEKLGEVILYGGSTHSRSSTPMRDSALWSWNGKRWKKITIAPSLRSDVILEYDPASASIILHGGHFNYSREKESHYHDTWQFNGSGWTLLSNAFPEKRLFHSAGTFDRKKSNLVVFGGYDATSDKLTSDLRILARDGWIILNQGIKPKPRNLHAVLYDASSQSIIVLGGDAMGNPVNDLWRFKNNTWELIMEKLPFTLDNPMGAVSLGESGDILCFASSSHTNTAETWHWLAKEKRWNKITGPNPSPRNAASMAFDPKRNCVVLFGGEIGIESVDEVWEFSLHAMDWKKMVQ